MTDPRMPASGPAEAFSLAGKTAIVTGASSGLGSRFVEVLASAGATVFAAARRTERLQALAERLDHVCPVTCDLTQDLERRRLVDAASKASGRVDVLVNNAGASGEPVALAETTASFLHVMDVNLAAPFHLSCLVASTARPEHPTSIVNIGSVLGLVAGHPVGGASYCASKAAITGLTRELAAQWAPLGIRVNTLAPGWFRSEMTEDLFADEKSRAWVARGTLLRRGGEPSELDGALLYLASAASSYMTGQVLVVDGGWSSR